MNLVSNTNNYDNGNDSSIKAMLPVDYEGPQLTLRMQKYLDENDISKFNPHTSMRSELLSLIFDDVTKSHQLL